MYTVSKVEKDPTTERSVALSADVGQRNSSRHRIDHPRHYTHIRTKQSGSTSSQMGFRLDDSIKYIWRADLIGSETEDLGPNRLISREIPGRTGS